MSDFMTMVYRVMDKVLPSSKEHTHTFDSINGVEYYGSLVNIKCSCGYGRTLSLDKPLNAPVYMEALNGK